MRETCRRVHEKRRGSRVVAVEDKPGDMIGRKKQREVRRQMRNPRPENEEPK